MNVSYSWYVTSLTHTHKLVVYLFYKNRWNIFDVCCIDEHFNWYELELTYILYIILSYILYKNVNISLKEDHTNTTEPILQVIILFERWEVLDDL